MNFLKRWSLFLFSLMLVYFLGYVYKHDFGFNLQINELLVELVHFTVFTIFGFFTCMTLCRKVNFQRPYIIYVVGIIFFVSVIGVFNEVRIHPEHGANVRDILLHLSAGTSGIIIWRLLSLTKKDIV